MRTVESVLAYRNKQKEKLRHDYGLTPQTGSQILFRRHLCHRPSGQGRRKTSAQTTATETGCGRTAAGQRVPLMMAKRGERQLQLEQLFITLHRKRGKSLFSTIHERRNDLLGLNSYRKTRLDPKGMKSSPVRSLIVPWSSENGDSTFYFILCRKKLNIEKQIKVNNLLQVRNQDLDQSSLVLEASLLHTTLYNLSAGLMHQKMKKTLTLHEHTVEFLTGSLADGIFGHAENKESYCENSQVKQPGFVFQLCATHPFCKFFSV
ncbi:uncharacterized protein LOC104857853 [Fukomys damarensis]|uniref:uncharacterized protein LOC104857853 n=1 Tax=Fukomys damarensis TaxID=885580 RepID=UPI00053FF38D|nr:uncharacterized protein LOC104857853 [Fukomys damarensis]